MKIGRSRKKGRNQGLPGLYEERFLTGGNERKEKGASMIVKLKKKNKRRN